MAHNKFGMGRPKKAEKSTSIRLPTSRVKQIKMIAVYLGVDPGDYVDDRFGPLLDKDEKKMMDAIEEKRKQKEGG